MMDESRQDVNNLEVQDREVPPLKQLYAYLTDGCNLSCRHCWLDPYTTSEKKKYRLLSAGLFEKAVGEAKDLGLQAVKLSGGEPLMHPEFTKFLDIIKMNSLDLVLETNGVLCSEKIAAEIATVPKRFVSVSIDGCDSETHDWIRRSKGSFDQAIKAVQMLCANGTSPQIIMTVMKRNYDQIASAVLLAEKLGASSIKFNIVQPTSRGKEMHRGGETLEIGEIIRIGHYVERELAPSTHINLFYDYPLAFRSLSSIAEGDGCSICGIHSIIGMIPDGSYAICGIAGHVKDFALGSIENDLLETVWRESRLLQEIRTGIPDRLDGVCSRCIMKQLCLGSCIAQNYYRRGSLWAPFWFCEEAEKAGVFPESRMAVRETPKGDSET